MSMIYPKMNLIGYLNIIFKADLLRLFLSKSLQKFYKKTV